ncbi:MAG TPA: 3-ketoacyl-ACP reductase [Vicinamibacteria bacterium]|nr:3-ketoacyl-ACP reductase [Vicinamibacteria bacterium]
MALKKSERPTRKKGRVPHRVALVTGGTRGIGLGIARALASEGWDLAIGGVRPESSVRKVLKELRGFGVDVLYCAADLAHARQRKRLVEAVVRRYGGVNALVNNAGRAPRVRADILEASEESFEELLRTNLQAPYFLTQHVARLMLERKRARPTTPAAVVFVTSVSGEMASTNRGEYCVSKAGLTMAARLFAARLAADGIAVYEVRPGIVATDMTAPAREAYDKRIAEGLVPEQRWGRPDDVGRVVAALLRGDLPYATGAVIPVDGGLSIPRL